MEKKAGDFFRLFRSLHKREKKALSVLSQYLNKKQLNDVKYLLKLKKVDLFLDLVNPTFFPSYAYPRMVLATEDKEVKRVVEGLKTAYEPKLKKDLYARCTPEQFLQVIAPKLVGFEDIKNAVLLQLFAKERFHVLLLGDPGTGKTEILHSVYDASPIASFGLGSGTTGAGLTVTIGREITPGLLPSANNGICCLDELNLLKKEDLGSLYNAMEKGFVTYDKGNTHRRFEANVRVLATANPRGDKFDEKKVKKQIPFDPALLSRFHLVFFVKKPTTEKFMDITKSIIRRENKPLKKDDVLFVKDYVKFADQIEVLFDKNLEQTITVFIKKIKDDEKKFLLPLTPRIVVGIINMAKAHARMHLRNQVLKEDLQVVLDIFKNSLYKTY